MVVMGGFMIYIIDMVNDNVDEMTNENHKKQLLEKQEKEERVRILKELAYKHQLALELELVK